MGWFTKKGFVAAPLGTASVTTPETPQDPRGYLWTQLAAANTHRALAELEAHAVAHCYSADGQFRKAIAAKRERL